MYKPSRMAARKVAMVAAGRLKRSSIDTYFAQRLVFLGPMRIFLSAIFDVKILFLGACRIYG